MAASTKKAARSQDPPRSPGTGNRDAGVSRVGISPTCAFDVVDDAAFARHWRRMQAGKWERRLVRFVEQVSAPGVVLYDIGAWCGPFTLIAAAKGARVVALEPDPVAFRMLSGNLALNGFRVHAYEAALGREAGRVTLFIHRNPGDSMTNALVPSRSAIDAEAMTFDDLPRFEDERVRVLKIDVEGMEYVLEDEIIDFFRERRCTLCLSLHPRNLWVSYKRSMPGFPARRRALNRTLAFIGRLEAAGGRPDGGSGLSVRVEAVVKCLFLPRVGNMEIMLHPGVAP